METPIDAKALLERLPYLPEEVREEAIELIERIAASRELLSCREDFMPFVKKQWPGFISGRHHAIMAEVFEKIARGELKRVCISMPPRHTKSEFSSYLLPAWFLGKFPEKKVIQAFLSPTRRIGIGLSFG